MVDKTENILVEFDYNNITIIDPNKVIDENGKAKERLVRQEDLVMYANLECKVLPRTKLAVGSANNDAIQTISIASINFLKPGGKEFLDNSWTDELTGKDTIKGEGVNQPNLKSVKNPNRDNDFYIRQTISSNGKQGATDNGLLGITSIDIVQNTSFMPVIKIKMVDVKGRALFEAGDNSPYAAFFNLPYPMFQLTIKGFYGKAIKLPLMLQSFTSSFNYTTTNFDIDLTFYTYKYTMLSELTMGAVLSVSNMFKNNLTIETKQGTGSQYVPVKDTVVAKGYQKVKEVYSEYKSKGLIPDDFPELTVTQMQFNIENFIKNIFDSFTKQNMTPLTNLSEYQKTIGDYKKDVLYAVNGSWFSNYMDNQKYVVLKDGKKTRIYSFKKEIVDIKSAKSELESVLKKYNDLLNNNDTVGQNGKYEISGKKESTSITCKISLNDFIVKNVNIDNDIDLNETYLVWKKVKQKPTDVELSTFAKELKDSNVLNTITVKKSDGTLEEIKDWFIFESGSGDKDITVSAQLPSKTFIDKLNEISKTLKGNREKIETALTDALSELLQNKNSGLGFIPNIRNVLAVIFANGEAFIRMLDDVHKQAWDINDNEEFLKFRKQAIFNTQVAGASQDNLDGGDSKKTPIYPWPQLIVATTGEKGQEKYEIRYPGDITLESLTNSNIPDAWPEVDFVEEFIRALSERQTTPTNPIPTENPTTNIKRISFNAIEFPIGNDIFSNKEEVKFFFEIYERILLISTTSKLSRAINSNTDLDKIVNVIAECENVNLSNSLSSADPFLIKKLTDYGLNASNFLLTIKHFSNQGLGQSWQNFIRGIYNTSYIKNKVSNSQFDFINYGILNNTSSSPQVSIVNENDFSEYITGSTTSNNFDITDTYPFTNNTWVLSHLANTPSVLDAKQAFNTNKTLKYDNQKKIIKNFTDGADATVSRPITNFNYFNIEYPNLLGTVVNNNILKTFYQFREIKKQLPTEGNIVYSNYQNQLNFEQTTSIFNTPFFINSIQEGIENFRNFSQYPFVSSAYYFINSLPLATLREKFKTKEGDSQSELDYIFATLKKYGAIHKMPYAWVLKIGSVWYRYKKYVETGVDILDYSWSGFNYTNNYDPTTQDYEKVYSLSISGSQIDIVLQKTTVLGPEESTVINTGFYPKIINDFNVFYQGYAIYPGFTDSEIQSGFNSGVTLNYVSEAIINLPEGFDQTIPNRDLRIIPWSVSVDNFLDNNSLFIMPSHGSLFNQTLPECFDINTAPINLLKNEVFDNQGMYDGSVRLFWASPNYGYFGSDMVSKPSPEEYLKKILSGETRQENFSINPLGEYSKISEMFSIFEKDVLDGFEEMFLNFSKSIYDVESGNLTTDQQITTQSGGSNELPSENLYKNFQSMMRNMMKVKKEQYNDGTDFVTKIQNAQLQNITEIIKGFLSYDIVFKYGNPSFFERRLFQTFSQIDIVDPYTWEDYSTSTPNALPTNTNTVTLSQSLTNFPNEWKTLKTYVGFCEIPELEYTNNGSYITDFFVDLNIAFNVDNIKNFSPIIKIYATQKLNDNTIDIGKFYQLMTEYLNSTLSFQNKIIDNLMIKVQNSLPKTTISVEYKKPSQLDGGEQTKSEIYETFKAFNDKWISGNDFKTKTLFEDVLLLDRASRNIGEKILVDIFKLKNRLTNINTATDMLTFVQTILAENHFIVMNLPSYVNFYNVQDAVKNPIPKSEGVLEFANTMFGTYLNVDYRDSSPKMVCFYGGKPSEQLDLKNNVDYRFRNDSFDLRRASDNPLVENLIDKKDWDRSNKVVGFNVDIGPQNQQIFVGFDVNQSAGKATSETIEIINQMGNLNGNRGGSTKSTSLYNLYKNRSYGCSLTMMGNALIQPTMYFNLRNVPMFSGPYMILEVSHKISPGTFLTTVKGVRQPTAALPILDDYIQSLRKNLLTSIIDKLEQDKRAKKEEEDKSNNQKNQQNDVNKKLTNGNANSNSVSNCTPDSQYSTYVSSTPNETTSSLRAMYNSIISETTDIKLQKVIFCKMYLETGEGNVFKTKENNYAGITIEKYWGGTSSYFVDNVYYCGNDNFPYAFFNSLSDNVKFLVARWSKRMGTVEVTKQSITKFIILNIEPTIKSESVYNGFSQEDLSFLESKVEKAITFFDGLSA